MAQKGNAMAGFGMWAGSNDPQLQAVGLHGIGKIPEIQAAKEAELEKAKLQIAKDFELAKQRAEDKKDMMRFSASMRPAHQAQIIQTDQGPMQLVNGQAQPIMGANNQPIKGSNSEKPLTEDQAKATAWLVQATNAYKNMLGASAKDPSAMKPGINDAIAAIPSFGATSAIANSMRSDNRQKFMQGASSLSESLLRAATGAGVNKDEAEQKIKELTPVFGDSDAQIKQKMEAIPLYIKTLQIRSGPGAQRVESIIPKIPESGGGNRLKFDAQGNLIQ